MIERMDEIWNCTTSDDINVFPNSTAEVAWKSHRHGVIGERGTARPDGMSSFTWTSGAQRHVAQGWGTPAAAES